MHNETYSYLLQYFSHRLRSKFLALYILSFVYDFTRPLDWEYMSRKQKSNYLSSLHYQWQDTFWENQYGIP
uniref:Uncharacterized protein n=1 Tax=viral metagenome TaxID=1070528 RepID=A0A6C0IZ19_9ZZZZ